METKITAAVLRHESPDLLRQKHLNTGTNKDQCVKYGKGSKKEKKKKK